ncbi:MAG: META domain-containing protein [Anaerolineae bacterium]|jgi:heat shock protein HslJ
MRKRLFPTLVIISLLVTVLVVPATYADVDGDITGIQWQWAELTETEPASQSLVPDPENYVLILVADGSASLKADCNQVMWTYTLEDTSLSFNTVGPATLAFCGEDSLDQIFLSKLGMGGTVSLEDGRLILTLNENAGSMVFDNAGPAEATPATMPETGGALLVTPWAATVLAGLAALGTGMALRRRRS